MREGGELIMFRTKTERENYYKGYTQRSKEQQGLYICIYIYYIYQKEARTILVIDVHN